MDDGTNYSLRSSASSFENAILKFWPTLPRGEVIEFWLHWDNQRQLKKRRNDDEGTKNEKRWRKTMVNYGKNEGRRYERRWLTTENTTPALLPEQARLPVAFPQKGGEVTEYGKNDDEGRWRRDERRWLTTERTVNTTPSLLLEQARLPVAFPQ